MNHQNESISQWNLIESDPALFTRLIKEYGVKGLQVEELTTLDLSELQNMNKIHGFVFLFNYTKNSQISSVIGDSLTVQSQIPSTLFFANQVIPNACATFALLSIILNIKNNDNKIELGLELESFRSFVQDFPSDLKGIALTNCEGIRNAHNKFSGVESLLIDTNGTSNNNNGDNKDSEDLFHYVSYIFFEGYIYELDGLKSQPQQIAKCNTSQWTTKAIEAIKQRIEQYGNELRFSVMAIIDDKIEVLKEKILKNEHSTSENKEFIRQNLNEQMNEELRRRESNNEQNELRTFNYIPLAIEIFKLLAKEKKLDEIYEN